MKLASQMRPSTFLIPSCSRGQRGGGISVFFVREEPSASGDQRVSVMQKSKLIPPTLDRVLARRDRPRLDVSRPKLREGARGYASRTAHRSVPVAGKEVE